jgi:xanthine/uracil permease
METPVFTSDDRRLKKETPSSASTVLIMAGLFVCGITTLLSGLVVLVQVGWREA